MDDWFDLRKSSQVTAFFCDKEGGSIAVLKLVKLIYLSDRESMARSGFPITNDRHVSMPHGPANSLTLNFIDGNLEAKDWSDLIADREGNMVGLARAYSDADTDELSDAEIDAMEHVWAVFGPMDKFEIRNWTHENCPEWEDPSGSSTPIPLERTLRFLGVENASKFAKRVEASRALRSVFRQIVQADDGQQAFAD